MKATPNLSGKKVNFSLSVGRAYSPFSLTESEGELGPDDWAWRFLRLGADYRQAYLDAKNKQDENPQSRTGAAKYSDVNEHRTVFVDEQSCRETFGLSTWRDPELSFLPRLGDGASWFSPLRSVVVDPASARTGIDFNVGHGVFGLLKRRIEPCLIVERLYGSKVSASISFSVDCSVPPDGQLKSVKSIATQYARQLRLAGRTADEFASDRGLIILGRGNLFSRSEFRAVLASASPNHNPEEFWRLIGIDVVGNPGRYYEKYRSLLLKEYKSLVKAKLAKEPDHWRFWPRLSDSQGRGAGSPSDGHTLKAYVMIAECVTAGIVDSRKILAVLEGEGAGSEMPKQLPDGWHGWAAKGPRTARFDLYKESAAKYVKAGYKWLIHSQNPASSKP
jgi:hypothetical protein